MLTLFALDDKNLLASFHLSVFCCFCCCSIRTFCCCSGAAGVIWCGIFQLLSLVMIYKTFVFVWNICAIIEPHLCCLLNLVKRENGPREFHFHTWYKHWFDSFAICRMQLTPSICISHATGSTTTITTLTHELFFFIIILLLLLLLLLLVFFSIENIYVCTIVQCTWRNKRKTPSCSMSSVVVLFSMWLQPRLSRITL